MTLYNRGHIRFTGGKDCKDVVYIPPQGEKAANPTGAIDCKNAADFLLAFSSGSLPPRHPCINQLDRQPRCTAGQLHNARPIALYGLLTCHSAVYFCCTVSFMRNDAPPSFQGAPGPRASTGVMMVVAKRAARQMHAEKERMNESQA